MSTVNFLTGMANPHIYQLLVLIPQPTAKVRVEVVTEEYGSKDMLNLAYNDQCKDDERLACRRKSGRRWLSLVEQGR